MSDFRSDRMPSSEGHGFARRAWETYSAAVNIAAEPVVRPMAQKIAIGMVGDSVGFWVLWHAYGGFEGLCELGMSRTTIFRKVARFRKTFGAHPDEFEFPGLTVEPGGIDTTTS